jgi:hypothetical protein
MGGGGGKHGGTMNTDEQVLSSRPSTMDETVSSIGNVLQQESAKRDGWDNAVHCTHPGVTY